MSVTHTATHDTKLAGQLLAGFSSTGYQRSYGGCKATLDPALADTGAGFCFLTGKDTKTI